MPRVPLIDERSILPDVSPIPGRYPLDQPGRTQAAIGQAAEQGLGGLGDTLARIGIERDDTAAREASVAANGELRVRYQKEIATRQMGDATGAAQDTATLFDEIGRSYEEKLSPRQRELFARHYQSNRPTYLDMSTRHEIDQKALHEDFVRQRQAGSHVANAEMDVLNEAARERELSLGLQAIYTKQPLGTPREKIEAEADAYRSLFHVRIANKLSDIEPLQAKQYMDAHAAEIDSTEVSQKLRDKIERRSVNSRAAMEADALIAETRDHDEALKRARGITDTAVRDEAEQRIRMYQQDQNSREAEAQKARLDQNERRWRTLSRDESGKLVVPARAALDWIDTLEDVSEREKYTAEYDHALAEAAKPVVAEQTAAAKAEATAQRKTEAQREQDAVWGRWNRLTKAEKLTTYNTDGLAKFGLVGANHTKALTEIDGIRKGGKPKSREWATKVVVDEAGITDDARVGRIISTWEDEIAALPGPEVSLADQRALLLNLTRDDLEVAEAPGGFAPFFGGGNDIEDITEIADDEQALSRVVIPPNEKAEIIEAIGRSNAKLPPGERREATDAYVRRIWMRQFFPGRDPANRAIMGR